eukprot:gene21900-33645_t
MRSAAGDACHLRHGGEDSARLGRRARPGKHVENDFEHEIHVRRLLYLSLVAGLGMSSYVVNHEGVTIEEAPLGAPVTCDTGVKTPPVSVGGLVRENTSKTTSSTRYTSLVAGLGMSSYVVNHEGVTIEEAPLGTPVTCDTGVKTPPDSVGGLVRENTFENDFEHEIHEESVLPSAPAVRILPGDALNFDESFREAVPMPMMSQSNEGGSHDSTHFDAPFALEHTLPTRRNSAIRMVPTLQPLQPLVSSPQPAQPNPINAEFYDPSAKPPVAADTRPQTQPDGDDPDTDNDDSTGFDDDEDFATSGEYNSKKVMVALEALAPKTTSHCWVVQQDAAGKLDVMTPNTFEDFLEFAKPHFSRDHLRVADDIVLHERHGPRKPTTHQWVDMQGLSETEVRQLGNKLVLHELTIEDM